MRCRRCGGWLVEEDFCYSSVEGRESDPPGVRCCNCGNVEDATVRTNRSRSFTPKRREFQRFRG